MSTRQKVVKTVLWGLIGVLAAVTLARFHSGLGSTTGLSDATPWGLWIAFDVMAGVALAAGGFTLAATVYIFRLEKYQCFARPAILTAFLGYAAVATGLFYDLGLPWRVWFPLVSPQPRSVLFEVGMCVILYLTVLLLEFAPVVLEHPRFRWPVFRKLLGVLKRATIPLVITGIVLSTLHQSSLGSLFLITPHRLHPLWYSPVIWILFLVSAIGLGLMMVTLESFFSAWFFGHRLRLDLLGGLGKAASVVLFLYVGLRVGDLVVRNELGGAFDGSFLGLLFLFEISASALVPAILLAIPRVRRSARGLAVASVMTVLGMIGYRFDVCIVAFERPEGLTYFPTWMEVAVSLGIVAGAVAVFVFFVENLKVYDEDHGDEAVAQGAPEARSFDRGAPWPLLPDSLATPRRHTLALLLGVTCAAALLPEEALFGAEPQRAAVSRPRTVDGLMRPREGSAGHEIWIAHPNEAAREEVRSVSLMVIDGNRDGDLVLFHHDVHAAALGDEESCATCHHIGLPFQKSSPCHACHRDMYSETDIFDHASHIPKLGGNDGCERCHEDAAQPKTRTTAAACIDCHADMEVADSIIHPAGEAMSGLAVGHVDAMHGLCVTCHEQKLEQDPQSFGAGFADCLNCHRGADELQLRGMSPYARSQEPEGRTAP